MSDWRARLYYWVVRFFEQKNEQGKESRKALEYFILCFNISDSITFITRNKLKKLNLSGIKYISLVFVIAFLKVIMKYILPLSVIFSNYDKVLFALTGLTLLWITYIRSQSFKDGRIYFIFYWITAIPSELILATKPYEPPKYMLQILNISALLCFSIVVLLTIKNSNISKTHPECSFEK